MLSVKVGIKDLKVDTPPPNKKIIELALCILKEDRNIDPTDAIISAHALSDKNSVYLFTMDTGMIGSMVLTTISENLKNNRERKYKLKVTNSF